MPPRYSRHYYDFVSMARKGVLDKALEKPDLLAQVADFKNKFYPRRWAHYEAARIGTLKLSPQDSRIEELKRDYKEMRSMIYGYYPEFNEILEMIAEIEHKINNQ